MSHPTTPHAENAAETKARIAKEDADRQAKGLPAYTDAERAEVEAERAAAVKAAADKAAGK